MKLVKLSTIRFQFRNWKETVQNFTTIKKIIDFMLQKYLNKVDFINKKTVWKNLIANVFVLSRINVLHELVLHCLNSIPKLLKSFILRLCQFLLILV